MNRVKLAGTDLEVSPVCLGCWQFNGGAQDITWSPQEEKVRHFKKIWVNISFMRYNKSKHYHIVSAYLNAQFTFSTSKYINIANKTLFSCTVTVFLLFKQTYQFPFRFLFPLWTNASKRVSTSLTRQNATAITYLKPSLVKHSKADEEMLSWPPNSVQIK